MNAPGDFLIQLRAATAETHHQLEQTPLSLAVMSPDVPISDYIAYLHVMLAIHTGIEENIFPAVAMLIPDIEERRKTALIKADLQALDAHIPDVNSTFTDENYRNSLPFNLGILYVSEGSTLGGKVILKNVSAAAERDITNASRFFNAYGEHTGSQWKAFLAQLTAYAETAGEKERSEILAGAIYGFDRTAALFSVTMTIES